MPGEGRSLNRRVEIRVLVNKGFLRRLAYKKDDGTSSDGPKLWGVDIHAPFSIRNVS